jgi:threonine/homoserine/homoserine lactone efflux protein
MTRVLAGGYAEGRKVALGTTSGLYVHATMAAVGLAALVMASSRAFAVLKLVGAAYLVAIGIAALIQRESRGKGRLPWSNHGSYVQAFLGNVLNPKAAGVYLTLLPQFVDPGRPLVPQIYLLATVHVVVALTYLTLLSHAVAAAGVVLTRPAWRAWMQRLTGAVLVFFGLRTAVTAR